MRLASSCKTMYFNRLVSNIKCDTDVALEPCTAVVGANQTNKTSILDAYRLALTGQHPIGADPSAVYELAQAGYDTVKAVLYPADSDTLFTYDLYAPAGKPRKPTHATPFSADATATALPLVAVGDLLTLGPAKAREAFLKRFGVAAAVPMPLALSPAQEKLWGEITAEVADTTDAVTVLAGIGTVLRSRKTRRSKDALTLERNIEIRRAGLEGTTAGVELLPQYETQLQQALAWSRTAALRARKATLEDVLAAPAPATPPAVVTSSADQTAAMQHFITVLEHSVAKGTCLCCKAGKVTPARLEEVRSKFAATVTPTNNAEAHAAYATWQSNQARAKAELQGLEIGLADAPTAYTGPSAEDLRAKIDRIKAGQTARKALTDDVTKLRVLRAEIDDGKVLEKEAAKLLVRLLEDVAVKATDAVNKYMPEDLRASLEATEKECRWRVVGKDDRPHRRGGMSGREWGSLLVALALAWTEGAPFRALLLDDVELGAFDPVSLRAVLGCIRAAVDRGELNQAIIVSSRPGEIPEEWFKVYR